MGLLSWLFPSPADRVNRARRLLDEGQPARARDEVEGVEGAEADAVRADARRGLMRLNLTLARQYAEGGGFNQAEDHLALAEEHADPGDPELREGRRVVREARASEANTTRPAPVRHKEGDDPIFSLPPDDPRLRYALMLEGWPDALRLKVAELGPEFAQAAMLTDDGDPVQAVQRLSPFTEREPAALFERAKALRALNHHSLAAQDLTEFARWFGHQTIGAANTAVMLVESLASGNQLDDALAVCESQLKDRPDDLTLGMLRASIFEVQGKLAEADEAARRLARKHAKQPALYRLMARCRLRAGKRLEAMQALEMGLQTCCESGKSGSLPFDVEAGRMLAQLYLEDRIEPERAMELVGQVKANLEKPGWFESYLDALIARNLDEHHLPRLLRALSIDLPPDDPRRPLLMRSFGESALTAAS